MTDAYIYCADIYCPDCIRNILVTEYNLPHDASLSTCEDILAQVLTAAGRDPDRESSWDSDEFPKGPYSDGGGEADTPQHCGACHRFLENPLTEAGYDYVIENLKETGGNPEVKQVWLDYYGTDYLRGRPVIEYLEAESCTD